MIWIIHFLSFNYCLVLCYIFFFFKPKSCFHALQAFLDLLLCCPSILTLKCQPLRSLAQKWNKDVSFLIALTSGHVSGPESQAAALVRVFADLSSLLRRTCLEAFWLTKATRQSSQWMLCPSFLPKRFLNCLFAHHFLMRNADGKWFSTAQTVCHYSSVLRCLWSLQFTNQHVFIKYPKLLITKGKICKTLTKKKTLEKLLSILHLLLGGSGVGYCPVCVVTTLSNWPFLALFMGR